MNDLTHCFELGLNEREAAHFLASSGGGENAAEALDWVAHEAITVMQREGLPHEAAMQKIFRLLTGAEEFVDGDFNFPKLPRDRFFFMWEGAQALCSIMLEKMHSHSRSRN